MSLDDFWESIFSGDPVRVRDAWGDMTDDEARAVLDHLRRMTTEDGWAEAQRQSAETALRLIREQAEMF